MLTEGMVLAGAGTLAGIGLAWWLVAMASSMTLPSVPRLTSVAVDGRTLLMSAALGLVTGLLFSLAPLWSLRRRIDVGSRGSLGSASSDRVRATFVVAQVSLALLLVVASGLLVRSFWRLAVVDPGFSVERVLSMQVSAIASPRWRTDRGTLFAQLRERLAREPGIISVGAVNHLPLAGDAWGTWLFVEGADQPTRLGAVYRVAEPGYIRTMDIPLTEGRDFTPQDDETAPGVVLVNAAFARRYLGGRAIGRRVSLTGEDEPRDWASVVGVIADVKQQEWSSMAA